MSPHPSAERCTEDLFLIYELAFRFRTNHPAARRCLAGLYVQFPGPETTTPILEAALEKDRAGGFRWMVGDRAETRAELSGALWDLEASLCEAIIRSQRCSIAIHAAALVANGSAALIVGRSGAGKSTLSVALARRGYVVASDDVTLVEPNTLNVLPIPRCFHLDHQSINLLKADGLQFPPAPAGTSFLAPSDFGVTAIRPCRARVLVLIWGLRGDRPQLMAVSQAEMAARLLQETGQGPLTDGETVGVLSRLAAGAACYKLIAGPLSATADALAELIDPAGTGQIGVRR